MKFEDHFSRLADSYARYQPAYPQELFRYLRSTVPSADLVWDCGAGNGQAALELAKHFRRVVATDASAAQIQAAFPHSSIDYRVEPAEKVSLESHTVDLITVAIAVHWFNLEEFYTQVRRVLKPEGTIAVWAYELPAIETEIDRVVRYFYREVVGAYWPDRFRYVNEGYKTLPFPFAELTPPSFSVKTPWNLEELGGFLNTWSGTRRYLEKEGHHPVAKVWPALQKAWGDPSMTRELHWPINMRVGKP